MTSYSRVVIDLDVLERSYGFYISSAYGAVYSFLLYRQTTIATFLHVGEDLATTWQHNMLYGLKKLPFKIFKPSIASAPILKMAAGERRDSVAQPADGKDQRWRRAHRAPAAAYFAMVRIISV
jgi:hypothetical protein